MAESQKPLPEGLEDHSVFQRRFWAVQRMGWIVFALILLGCLFGAFGRGGPLSRAHVESSDGVVDLPVIARWNAPEEIVVTFRPSPFDSVFLVDGRFFELFSVETVDPPQKTTFARDGLTRYVFPNDSTRPTKVIFRLQTQKVGARRVTLGLEHQAAEHVIFVLP